MPNLKTCITWGYNIFVCSLIIIVYFNIFISAYAMKYPSNTTIIYTYNAFTVPCTQFFMKCIHLIDSYYNMLFATIYDYIHIAFTFNK